MSEVKGTKTEANLRAALAGESIARNKYCFFAAAARTEGQEEIAAAFERLAGNEMMHAKVWYEALNGKPKKTMENLLNAAAGEFDEWRRMYPEFAEQARADGLEELALMFDQVASIERDHEKQFMELTKKLSGGSVEPQAAQHPTTVTKDGYRCQFCGAVHERRLDVCPVCGAIGAFEACRFETTL